MNTIRYCTKCGASVIREARFCANCAARVFTDNAVLPQRQSAPINLKLVSAIIAASASLGVLLVVVRIRPVSYFTTSGRADQSNSSTSSGSPVLARPTPVSSASPSLSVANQMANSLEVSGANSAFEGIWGGYMSGMMYLSSDYPIRRVGPIPEGTSFLLNNGTIFLTFIITGDPTSAASGPKAWAPTPNEVVLRMQFDTFEAHAVQISRFKLKSAGISCTEETTVYDSHSGQLIGTIKTAGRFKKLDHETWQQIAKARAKYDALHGNVNLGEFAAPAEK